MMFIHISVIFIIILLILFSWKPRKLEQDLGGKLYSSIAAVIYKNGPFRAGGAPYRVSFYENHIVIVMLACTSVPLKNLEFFKFNKGVFSSVEFKHNDIVYKITFFGCNERIKNLFTSISKTP
ncbi:hypothetical protein HZU77_014760 [Neisseriaceae bacterium TC5R-5]|nr:hypothetical protein [Neisseriaceae bacterium TC5R-5]